MAGLSLLYRLADLALVGLPPLSGFIGKLLILHATIAHPAVAWIWTAVLVTTLIGVLGLARAGTAIFWKGMVPIGEQRETLPLGPAEFIPAAALVVLLVGLTLAAGPATAYMKDTGYPHLQPARHIHGQLIPGSESDGP